MASDMQSIKLILILVVFSLDVNAQEPKNLQNYFSTVTSTGIIYNFDANAKEFIDSITKYCYLNSNQILAIDTLVRDLKGQVNPRYTTADEWDSIHFAYIMIGGSAASCAFNLKSPSTFKLSFQNAPTIDGTGVSWNGTSQYAKTGYIINTSGRLNSTHLSYYSETSNNSSSTEELGARTTTSSDCFLGIRGSGNAIFDAYNSSTARINVANSTSLGFCLGNVISSTSASLYMNATSLGTLSATAGTLPTVEVYIGCFNNNGTAANFSLKKCAWASGGYGIPTANQAAFNNAVGAFQQRLNRATTNIF